MMRLNCKRYPKGIKDARVASSTWDVLDHIVESPGPKLTETEDDVQTRSEGSGAGVLKPKALARKREGLTVRRGEDEVALAESEEVTLSERSDVHRHSSVEGRGTTKDGRSEERAEARGISASEMLQLKKGSSAGDCILVTQDDVLEVTAQRCKLLNELDKTTTAKTKIV